MSNNRDRSTVAPRQDRAPNQEQRNVAPRALNQEQRNVAPRAPNQEQRNVAPRATDGQQRNVAPEQRNVPRTGGTSHGSDIAGTSPEPSSGGPSPTVPGNEPQIFSNDQLSDATNNFSSESLIARGDCGSVFKGRLRETGQLIAVKQLNHRGVQVLGMELHMHSRLRHSNIINLIGYSVEGYYSIVVYEFMPWGSLQHRLHDRSPGMEPLDWNTRMEIAFGVANAMDYLHNQPDAPIIFRNLKSSNVLLGRGFQTKLSDFGFAKLGPEPEDDRLHVSTMIVGNPGYWAPEYLTGTITMMTDVYGFGVLLLEIVTGEKASQGRHRLVDTIWPRLREGNTVRIADPGLRGQFPVSMLDKAIEWALACIGNDPASRPTIKEVMMVMDYLRSVKYNPNEGTSNTADGLPGGPGETSSSRSN
ncbi:Serine/threonine protein kinase [Handroanthus impetiginosus]|uniref:Serine/threonine protein kinase n=1 Tax=Handroanthus impetiginosus TaxID=429701 RepID=A0A2G9HPE1_9LAMI|nr:Serine/threonine protein kinase [Handroanthus impetiginosus]